jgi:hypothetical protein
MTNLHASVYVAYPRVAQNKMNDSTLSITRMAITDPAPDSFQLNLTQIIGNPGGFNPIIFAFNPSFTLAGSAVPFGHVAFPQTTSEDGTVVVVGERVQLGNESAFEDYTRAVMLNEEVNLNIYGQPQLKDGGLPQTTVTYNKTVTLKGEQHPCKRASDDPPA